MINLRTFFIDHFNSSRISDDNMKKFAQTHLSRLQASNTAGTYSALIAQTQLVYTPFEQAMYAEDYAHSTQQGNTVQVDDMFYNFKTLVSQKEGFVRGTWGINSPQYQAFFPEGLTEYSNCTKANVEMLMNRMISAADTYQGELGVEFLNFFTNLKDDYITARTNQLNKIGEVEVDKTATANARQALAAQLMQNVLVIASNHVGRTDMVEDFFDQSFIRSNAAPDDGSIADTIAPNTTVNIESMGINLNSQFTFINTGAVPLHFGIETNATAEVLNGLIVPPGATIQANYIQLLGSNASGSTYLNVTNHNAIQGGYSVLIE
jgi:hypothetical protein